MTRTHTRTTNHSVTRMMVFFLSLAVATTASVDRARADDEVVAANEAESKDCTNQIALCATGVGGAAAGIITQCKELRHCKKECRVEKRDCKKEVRGNKKSCKDQCRDEFGHGKEYRECAGACRDEKHEGKDDCKEEKTICTDVCRVDYKTPACKAARGAALLSVPACVAMVSCLASSSQSQQPDGQ